MIKQDKTKQAETIFLPLNPETSPEETDRIVHSRFMRHLQHVPSSRMEIKILSSIQFTADMLDYSDAHVAKILVDMGLRAPRMAFPVEFLSFTDSSLMRSGWEVGGPTAALIELKEHWDRIGEDRFATFKKQYSLLDEDIYTRC
ncbi:MAG: hypothetical protein DHS20C02_10400 [Micavibrio sp.]|nr:MAG: hypothetical protein DHS20C02_10400 [Micavibrio sp.]